MPYALLIIGIVLLVAGARGQSENLLQLVDEDFLSTGGYIPWAISILGIGAVGYIPKMKPISDAFMALVVVVLILANKGFFTNLQSAVQGIGGQTLAGSTSSGSTTASTSTGSGGLPSSVTSVLSGLQQQFGLGTSSTAGTGGPDTTGDNAINVSSNPAADNAADGIAVGALY